MESEPVEFVNDKLFDLYTHLKMNIKTSSPFCEIHESKYTHYCIGCKRSVCEVCKDSFHSTHSLQEKKAINFDSKKIDLIFKKLELLINTTRVFTEPDKMKKELVGKVNEEFDALELSLKELKKRKMKEIELVFGDNGNAKHLMSNIKSTKNKVTQFYNDFNSFFFNEEVKDEDNALFLQAYDIFNIGIGVSKEYISIIDQIRNYYQNFEDGKNKKTEDINRAIQSALEEEKKNEIFNTNLLVIDNSESNSVDLRSVNENDGFKVKVVSNFEKLGEDLFKELKDKLDKTTEFINSFKVQTFNSFKRHGSLVDIEKIVKAYDEKTNKRTNFIKGKSNLKFSPSQAKAYSITGALPSQAKILTQSQKLNTTTNSSGSGSADAKTANADGKANSSTSKSEEKDQVKEVRPKSVGKDGKPSKIYQVEEKKPDSKLLKDIKSTDIPKVKLAHFGQTTQKKNFKSLLEDVFNPGTDKGGLTALEEYTEEDVETVSKHPNHDAENASQDDEKGSDESQDENLFGGDEGDESVQLVNGFNNKKRDKIQVKLEKMFRPIMKQEKKINKPKQEKKQVNDEEKKYKVNNKLQEMIKENQRLCSMIKKHEDINLVINTIRRYYSYQALDFIRKNFYKVNKGYSSNLLFSSNLKEEHVSNDNVRVFEGTNEVQIYDRDHRKLIKKAAPLDKKIHGSNVFLNGCRTYYHADKLYITGGRDANEDKNYFWLYSLKDNKLSKLPPMNKARSYHTITFHENLKSILAVGGENNKTCEMFDFFLNTWNELPELNVPRANISLHIDKIGTFAYAVGGVKGDIANGLNSDAIELLDLVDINQGWAKVEYRNKANVDLKFCHTGVYPLTDDKLLIYGGLESRNTKKCYVIFDLRSFDILSISPQALDCMKIQSVRSPELSKIFSNQIAS